MEAKRHIMLGACRDCFSFQFSLFLVETFLGTRPFFLLAFLLFAIQLRLSYDDDGAVLQIDRRFGF